MNIFKGLLNALLIVIIGFVASLAINALYYFFGVEAVVVLLAVLIVLLIVVCSLD